MNRQFTKEILIVKCSASIDAKLMLHSDATTLDCQKTKTKKQKSRF